MSYSCPKEVAAATPDLVCKSSHSAHVAAPLLLKTAHLALCSHRQQDCLIARPTPRIAATRAPALPSEVPLPHQVEPPGLRQLRVRLCPLAAGGGITSLSKMEGISARLAPAGAKANDHGQAIVHNIDAATSAAGGQSVDTLTHQMQNHLNASKCRIITQFPWSERYTSTSVIIWSYGAGLDPRGGVLMAIQGVLFGRRTFPVKQARSFTPEMEMWPDIAANAFWLPLDHCINEAVPRHCVIGPWAMSCKEFNRLYISHGP